MARTSLALTVLMLAVGCGGATPALDRGAEQPSQETPWHRAWLVLDQTADALRRLLGAYDADRLARRRGGPPWTPRSP